MQDKNLPKNVERDVERLTLIVYCMHQIFMLGIAVYQHWPAWFGITFIAVLLIEVPCFAFKYGNTHTRQMIYVCMMEVCLILFSMHWGELIFILIPFASVVVLLGLTGYADLILNGDPEGYLKNVTGSHGLED